MTSFNKKSGINLFTHQFVDLSLEWYLYFKIEVEREGALFLGYKKLKKWG